MKNKIIKIESSDNTDVLILADKIQYVVEQKDDCLISFDNGTSISSGTKFKHIAKAIEEVLC